MRKVTITRDGVQIAVDWLRDYEARLQKAGALTADLIAEGSRRGQPLHEGRLHFPPICRKMFGWIGPIAEAPVDLPARYCPSCPVHSVCWGNPDGPSDRFDAALQKRSLSSVLRALSDWIPAVDAMVTEADRQGGGFSVEVSS